MIEPNFTTIPDFYNGSTYNTGCVEELNKALARCTTFKIEVSQIYGERLGITLIILILLIFFRIYINNVQPKFSQTEFFKKHIDHRIDLILIVLSICILYIFYFI